MSTNGQDELVHLEQMRDAVLKGGGGDTAEAAQARGKLVSAIDEHATALKASRDPVEAEFARMAADKTPATRGWVLKSFKSFGEEIAPHIAGHVTDALAPLKEKIAALEARLAA